jgi:hypothetical protein
VEVRRKRKAGCCAALGLAQLEVLSAKMLFLAAEGAEAAI